MDGHLETNKGGRHPGHLMLQFTRQDKRAISSLFFEGLRPNTQANDLLGEGCSKKRWQSSVDGGHFHCFGNKLGTVRGTAGKLCAAGNYGRLGPAPSTPTLPWAPGTSSATRCTKSTCTCVAMARRAGCKLGEAGGWAGLGGAVGEAVCGQADERTKKRVGG